MFRQHPINHWISSLSTSCLTPSSVFALYSLPSLSPHLFPAHKYCPRFRSRLLSIISLVRLTSLGSYPAPGSIAWLIPINLGLATFLVILSIYLFLELIGPYHYPHLSTYAAFLWACGSLFVQGNSDLADISAETSLSYEGIRIDERDDQRNQ